MLRSLSRLISVRGKTSKNNKIHYINVSSLRFTQSLAETTTLDNFKTVEVTSPLVVFLIDATKGLGFHEDDIKLAIQNQPGLLTKSPTVWNSVLGSLLNGGMYKKDVLSVLEKWPQVLSLKKNELDKNLEAWFRCRLGNDLMFKILATHPYLLQVHHANVEKRIKQYQIFFESRKMVGNLLLLAPNVLEENWDELLDKLNYLDGLCTEKRDILTSGVLAHSSLHIQARHEFLIRAGIYKRPSKDFNKKLCKNPKLAKIVNSSDNEFAFNVAGLTLLEYEVFFKMFEKEYEERKEDELDSDGEKEFSRFDYSDGYKPSRR